MPSKLGSSLVVLVSNRLAFQMNIYISKTDQFQINTYYQAYIVEICLFMPRISQKCSIDWLKTLGSCSELWDLKMRKIIFWNSWKSVRRNRGCYNNIYIMEIWNWSLLEKKLELLRKNIFIVYKMPDIWYGRWLNGKNLKIETARRNSHKCVF